MMSMEIMMNMIIRLVCFFRSFCCYYFVHIASLWCCYNTNMLLCVFKSVCDCFSTRVHPNKFANRKENVIKRQNKTLSRLEKLYVGKK